MQLLGDASTSLVEMPWGSKGVTTFLAPRVAYERITRYLSERDYCFVGRQDKLMRASAYHPKFKSGVLNKIGAYAYVIWVRQNGISTYISYGIAPINKFSAFSMCGKPVDRLKEVELAIRSALDNVDFYP